MSHQVDPLGMKHGHGQFLSDIVDDFPSYKPPFSSFFLSSQPCLITVGYEKHASNNLSIFVLGVIY